MNAKSFVPPLRLEIRDKSEAGDTPWHFFDTAQTETQAQDKLKRHRISDTCETRVVENTPVTIAKVEPIIQDTPGTLQLLEQIQTENLALRREANQHAGELAKFKTMPTTPNPLDAVTGETPLPFGVGDLLRDVHTGVAVRVTQLNSTHKTGPCAGQHRPGFEWENMTTKPGDNDHTGFCPLASVGCFVKIKEGDALKIDPTGKETAAPQEIPPAAEITQTAPPVAGAPITSSGPIAAPGEPAMPTAPVRVNRPRTVATRSHKPGHKKSGHKK